MNLNEMYNEYLNSINFRFYQTDIMSDTMRAERISCQENRKQFLDMYKGKYIAIKSLFDGEYQFYGKIIDIEFKFKFTATFSPLEGNLIVSREYGEERIPMNNLLQTIVVPFDDEESAKLFCEVKNDF